MRQSYTELEIAVNQINEKVKGSHIQDVWSSPHLISMRIRLPGETKFLIMGRGGEWEFLCLSEKNIPTEVRLIDKFLNFLRKNIRGQKIKDISLSKKDRLVRFVFEKAGKESVFLIQFNKRIAKILFFSESEEKLFSSMTGKWISLKKLENEEKYFFIPEMMQKSRNAKFSFSMEKYLKSIRMEKIIKKRRSKLEKKKRNINKDLTRFSGTNEIFSQLQEDSISLSSDDFSIGGFKIKFHKHDDHFKRRDLMFKKIKNLNRGKAILEERLKEVEGSIRDADLDGDYSYDKKIIKVDWGQLEKKSVAKKLNNEQKGNFKVYKIDNMKLAVGLNVDGNIELKRHWASKNDLWFHINNAKSAHAFLKIPNEVSLEPKILDLIGSILGEKSGFNSELIPLVYTKTKFVKNLKGSKGTVIHTNARYYDAKKVNAWQEKVTEI